MTKPTLVLVDSGELHSLVTKLDNLTTMFSKFISEKEKQEKKHFPGEAPQRLCSPKQLAKALGRCEPTIYAWRKAGKIKSYSMGRSTYFDFDEVMQALKS